MATLATLMELLADLGMLTIPNDAPRPMAKPATVSSARNAIASGTRSPKGALVPKGARVPKGETPMPGSDA
jgi:hypothetical protein